VADAIVKPGGKIPHHRNVLRALNPRHFVNGLPGDQHFVMSRDHDQDDGVSVGVEGLISVQQLRQLSPISSRYGDCCAVAVLNTGDIVDPVIRPEIMVVQQDDAEWGDFSSAHAIITGYQAFPHGAEGRKKIKDFQRHLVRLASNRFIPAGEIPA